MGMQSFDADEYFRNEQQHRHGEDYNGRAKHIHTHNHTALVAKIDSGQVQYETNR